MKKVLLVVALLLLATPVFAADVTVTATPASSFTGNFEQVTVGYTGAAEANSIRGFALVLTVDSGFLLDNIRDFNRGESTRPGGGYGIFPGKFRDFVNAASPNWVDINYNPLAPWNDLNSQSGNNYMKMVVELGTLFVEPNAPGTSGTLFAIDVNKGSTTATDCNLCFAVDATRGGVVKKDATGATVTLPGTYRAEKGTNCITITAGQPQVAVPNVVGMTRVAAINALVAAQLIKGVEANVAPTAAGQTVGNVLAQKPAAGTMVNVGSAVDVNVLNYPIKWSNVANSLYVNWANRGKPQCWAYPRQCHGDADGKKLGTIWTSNNDLIILKAGIGKLESQLAPGNICADFDHKKLGTIWVSNNDLIILKAYIGKLETAVPMCGSITAAQGGFSVDPNYWYWCTPTGGSGCPTGQYCAPIGVCPNTP